MGRTVIAVSAAALSLAAAALLTAHAGAAPEGGDNVLIVAPRTVQVPDRLPGDCRVEAVVLQVLDGSAFRTGQSIAIRVPCSDRAPVLDRRPATPLSPDAKPAVTGLDPMVLRRSRRGFVHLDDAGGLIWTPSRKLYGAFGRIGGYRVLDGVRIPLADGGPRRSPAGR